VKGFEREKTEHIGLHFGPLIWDMLCELGEHRVQHAVDNITITASPLPTNVSCIHGIVSDCSASLQVDSQSAYPGELPSIHRGLGLGESGHVHVRLRNVMVYFWSLPCTLFPYVSISLCILAINHPVDSCSQSSSAKIETLKHWNISLKILFLNSSFSTALPPDGMVYWRWRRPERGGIVS
jgi:hypothetical protein